MFEFIIVLAFLVSMAVAVFMARKDIGKAVSGLWSLVVANAGAVLTAVTGYSKLAVAGAKAIADYSKLVVAYVWAVTWALTSGNATSVSAHLLAGFRAVGTGVRVLPVNEDVYGLYDRSTRIVSVTVSGRTVREVAGTIIHEVVHAAQHQLGGFETLWILGLGWTAETLEHVIALDYAEEKWLTEAEAFHVERLFKGR